MNYWISVLFRIIPLAMGAICLGYGWYIWDMDSDANTYVAGHVVLFLSIICVALFTTAATIIRQLIHTYSAAFKVALPLIGSVAAAIGIIGGLIFVRSGTGAEHFVAGHVVFGLGLITCCVSTVALSSTKFILIPSNSKAGPGHHPDQAFSGGMVALLFAIPIICALIGIVWGIDIVRSDETPNVVAGHVLAGIGRVCASLVALVASVVRQIQNTYSEADRRFWPWLVIVMGTIDILWGLYLLIFQYGPVTIAPGFVLIGLGIVCYSILSKVLLLALVWRHPYPLAKRIPLIPVLTALTCLFIAAFLFEAATINPAYMVPARVMVGLGGICFTLFSIVSILESGTSS